MLKKKNYTIVGITPEMAKKWEKEFRDDLGFYINAITGEIEVMISLTVFEAILVRAEMIVYNLTHPCVLSLEKYEGEEFRV